jgi:hypothetical protein
LRLILLIRVDYLLLGGWWPYVVPISNILLRILDRGLVDTYSVHFIIRVVVAVGVPSQV